jgi:hypothetical protein
MKIVFGLLSCKDSAAAVVQFAKAVWPHVVLVHHDFSKFHDFDARAENIYLVDHHVQTRWGDWSLVEAALVLMRQALERFEFDYFQLVSESCMPIRPMAHFENHLQTRRPTVMMNRFLIDSGDGLYNFGWRYFSTVSLFQRIMRRAGAMYLGKNRSWRAFMGVNLRLPAAAHGGWRGRLSSLVGALILRLFSSRLLSDFPAGAVGSCWVGSQWFGASREATAQMLSARLAWPSLARHYAKCPIPDESYFHTLIAATSAGPVIAGNHYTSWASAGSGPDQLQLSDLPALLASDSFFARKLSLNPLCPLRLALLENTRTVPVPAAHRCERLDSHV